MFVPSRGIAPHRRRARSAGVTLVVVGVVALPAEILVAHTPTGAVAAAVAAALGVWQLRAVDALSHHVDEQ